MSKLDELAALTHAAKDDLLNVAEKMSKEMGHDPHAPQQSYGDGTDDLTRLCKTTGKRILNTPIFNPSKPAPTKGRSLGS